MNNPVQSFFFLVVICCLTFVSRAQMIDDAYTLHGNIDSIQSIASDSKDWLTSNYYDTSNRLIKQISSRAGEIRCIREFRTDTLSDRIIYRDTYLGSVIDKINNYIEIERIYDSLKRVIRENRWSYKCKLDKKDLLGKSFAYFYDSCNRVVSYKSMSYMVRDTLLQWMFEMKYDKYSKIIEGTRSALNKDRVWVDSAGLRIVKEEQLQSPKITSKSIYKRKYNKQGLLVKEKTICYSYEKTEDNKSKEVTVEFYKYDSLNNCIQTYDKRRHVYYNRIIYYRK